MCKSIFLALLTTGITAPTFAFSPNNNNAQLQSQSSKYVTNLHALPAVVVKDENLTFGSTLDLSRRKAKTSTSPFTQVIDAFPGALTNKELIQMIDETLTEIGYDKQKTLVATSLCCDEVNRPLESDIASTYTNNFWMGGLAGFPFGGAVAFGAMAAHIPDDGSCLMIYGPHVGVDSEGNVGTVECRGRVEGGSCCGSAVAASGYVADVLAGKTDKASIPDDIVHAQQAFVGDMLLPFAQRLEDAENKMAELPYALYEAQTGMVGKIIDKAASGVAGDGKIAVLGGIQINTPVEYSDYFLPLSFKLYNNKGELVKELGKDTTELEIQDDDEEETVEEKPTAEVEIQEEKEVLQEEEEPIVELAIKEEKEVEIQEEKEEVQEPIVELKIKEDAEDEQEEALEDDGDDDTGVIPAKLNFRLRTSDGQIIKEILPGKYD